ncbi:MAG: protease HtpX [Pseudomonadota bacterium]
MLRVALFLMTNFAVVLLLSVVTQLLGVDQWMTQSTGIDYSTLLGFCAVLGFGGAFISLFMSKIIAKWRMKVQIIKQPANSQEEWLIREVKSLAQKAGIGMPEVGYFHSPASNAFATGWNRNNSLVAVSTGLLDRFSQEEARAVLAHEVAHIANGDMVTMTLLQGVLNTFVYFIARIVGTFVDQALSRGEERSNGIGYFITTIVAEIVLGILASVIVAWFSRRREFRADAGGGQYAGKHSMIAALERLRSEQGAPSGLEDSLAAFGIRAGMNGNVLSKLFSSHPPLEHRIQSLKQNS